MGFGFTDVFIKRPVFATTLSLLLLLLGIVSYLNIPVRQFPLVETSVIQVQTYYSGASSELMESFVTTPIENALSGIDGLDYISSVTKQGSSSINISLKLGSDLNKAMTDISNRVASVKMILPKDIKDPIISEQDPNAEPTMYLVFWGKNFSDEELTDYVLRSIQPQLQTQPGVAQAAIYGGREYAMRVWLDPGKMAAHQVTAPDIESAIRNSNIQSAAGQIENEFQVFNVNASTDIHTPQQFNDLVIRNDNGKVVRISDVGKAEYGASDYSYSVNMSGAKGVVVGIIPKSDANPLEISKNINSLFPKIQEHFPKGMSGIIIHDASKFIAQSLHEVRNTILEACLFVFIVVFLMIGSLRTVLIPVVTIPLSLIGSCAVMMMLGFTINTLTLLAWMLAVGLVVDDSIVVLENIHRHLEEGKSPFDAAIMGAREIAFAVITMTFTLAAVYAPIGFMGGMTGKLFTEFAFTLAGAVIVSGFIALTLSPMMCSKLFKKDVSKKEKLEEFANNIFTFLRENYRSALDKVLQYRFVVVIAAILVYGACYALYSFTPSELAPTEDHGAFMTIVSGPASANLAYTEKHTKMLEGIYHKIPELTGYGIINGFNGVNGAFSFIVLKQWGERTRTTEQIKNSVFPAIWSIPGVMAFPASFPSLPGPGRFTPIAFVLKTTDTFENLEKAANLFKQKAQEFSGLMNVDVDLKIDKPETFISINRNKASDLGIPINSVASSLNLFLGTPEVTRFTNLGRSYEVIPELYSEFRNSPESLNNIQVRTNSGELISLSNIISIEQKIAPRSVAHFQQLRSVQLTASLAPGVTLGQAMNYLDGIAKKILPNNIEVDYDGESRQYVESSGQMTKTFIFALLFIYLILAAQFESFVDPLVVMLSVPLALAGALLVLRIGGGTLNIYTQIGLITLIGLITKNGILIVEFANQQQRAGAPFRDAIINAASWRLRPILMTTMAMFLGSMPLVLAKGAGSVSRTQMGLVITGGISFGTLLTLFVVPVAYYIFAKRINKEE